jgi:hypothetical protein
VVERIRDGYQSQLARIDRRLEAINAGAVDGVDPVQGPGGRSDGYDGLLAEQELRKLVIATERVELGRLVARRKVSERVAEQVRAALDVDETTLRP